VLALPSAGDGWVYQAGDSGAEGGRMTDTQQAAQLRLEITERREEHVPEWYLMLNESEVVDIASGFVPSTVKAMALMLLDQQNEDQRRAARPVRSKGRAA
jgi:hypothetical protein